MFKDFGEKSDEILTLRAKNIKLRDGGELWIGSRKHRYQGKADIVLYGDLTDHEEDNVVGHKFLHVSNQGVLEMHGKEKLHWTTLEDHVFKDNVPLEQLYFFQTAGIKLPDASPLGNRLVFHVLTTEGDHIEGFAVPNGGLMTDAKRKIDALHQGEIILFNTDFLFAITPDVKEFFVSYGFEGDFFDTLMETDVNARLSQIGGFFDKNGQRDIGSISPMNNGNMHRGLKTDFGRIALGGMKSGHEFQLTIGNNWFFNNRGEAFTTEQFDETMAAGGWDAFEQTFRNTFKGQMEYTGARKGEAPIITVTDDLSTWEVGDKVRFKINGN